MQTIACQLQYKKGAWYFKTFSKRPDHFIAMANSMGFPENYLDFLNHHAWFATGGTPLEACQNLEKKMGGAIEWKRL